VMFLDLDRFKMMNDTYGHSFGDHLLQQVSARFKTCLEGKGRLFRYGGDEFVIVVKEPESHRVSEVAQKLIDCLSSPFSIKGRQTFISTSIGISLFPKDGNNVEMLIQNADIAMYSAKENGKNNFQNYTSALNQLNSRRMEIELGIRRALENNEFTLVYQPQVNLKTTKIIGFEALIRWKHPEHGDISPAEFIPVAEETGLIVPIGKWVLTTASRQCKQWLNMGFPLHRMAVNVSAIQFREKDFVHCVKQVLESTELDPQCLELEITESVTRNVEEARKTMKQLTALGVHLSIDDFGTGYSSLKDIRHFPIDKLKIDKSFVDEIHNQVNGGEAIVRTIIELGNSLGFTVIAEGVEQDKQIEFLVENNCHQGQGYFFSKPLPAEEVEELYQKCCKR